jgi:penicillin-binding protein 2B
MHKRIKRRALLLAFLFTLAFVVLAIRVFYIQVVQGPSLVRKASVQLWNTTQALQPVRGSIFDRNGNVLAQDAIAYTLSVNPKMIHKYGAAHDVVKALAPLLGLKKQEDIDNLYDKVTKKNSEGKFYIQREIRPYGWKMDATLGTKIQAVIKKKKLIGVYLMPEEKRYYPSGELAAHVVGYMSKEGQSAMGLEVEYDKLLKGKPGKISYEKDRLGYEVPGSKVSYKAPVNGDRLQLTLDSSIQSYMEQALLNTYNEYHPKAMMAIAANPNTMEILGLANYPTFDPNKYWNAPSQDNFRQSAISNVYEPGSTFKIVTLAGAVQEGIFNPTATYMSGKVRIGGYWIKDHNGGLGWGKITYLEGLKRSSNIAFVKLGYEQLGGVRLKKYIDKFGFGVKTGIDLPGEMAGQISFRQDIATEVATATFGQGRVEVTAMQQLAAVSAIANGGKLLKPYIVKKVLSADGKKVIKENKPTYVRRVISESTARKVSGYLEQVVSDQEIGTGRRAYIPGYRIAGKTGTAQKVVNGRYSTNNQYVMSFVGFAPADKPKIALIIIVDEPKVKSYQQGGYVVGPLFKSIMKKSLMYLGVQAQQVTNTVHIGADVTAMPNVVGLSKSYAESKLRGLSLPYRTFGSGESVLIQDPVAGSPLNSDTTTLLFTSNPKQLPLPSLEGLSLREALRICTWYGVQANVVGSGYVKAQSWVGTPANKQIKLVLGPLGKVYTGPPIVSPSPTP